MGCTDSKDQPGNDEPKTATKEDNPLVHDQHHHQQQNQNNRNRGTNNHDNQPTPSHEHTISEVIDSAGAASPIDASVANRQQLFLHHHQNNHQQNNNNDDDPLQLTAENNNKEALKHEDIPKIPFPAFARPPPQPFHDKESNPFISSESSIINQNNNHKPEIIRANPNATNPRDRPLDFTISSDTTTSAANTTADVTNHHREEAAAQEERANNNKKDLHSLMSPQNQKRRISQESSLLIAAATLACASHEHEAEDHLGSTNGTAKSESSPRR